MNCKLHPIYKSQLWEHVKMALIQVAQESAMNLLGPNTYIDCRLILNDGLTDELFFVECLLKKTLILVLQKCNILMSWCNCKYSLIVAVIQFSNFRKAYFSREILFSKNFAKY